MKNPSLSPLFKAIARAVLPLTVFLLCTGASSTGSAKEFKLPNADFAVASIAIPKDWKPEAIDNGVEAQSEDGTFYLAVTAAGTDKGIDADVEGTKDMLKEHKVKIDESSKKMGKGDVNGFPTESVTIKGKDEDGPCTVTILLVTVKNKYVIITYWFTDADLAKHEKEVEDIQKSLKASE